MKTNKENCGPKNNSRLVDLDSFDPIFDKAFLWLVDFA